MTIVKSKVLVVDDEPQIRRFLRAGLSSHAYDLIEAINGQEALSKAETESPDVVILDLGLPDIDGIEIIAQIRKRSQVPIIVLSVRASDMDKMAALEQGADDYITKPFDIEELLTRLQSTLQHMAETAKDVVIVFGHVRVDLGRRVVWVNDAEIELSRKEYAILKTLIANAGRVLTHQHLLREVWGAQYVNQTHYLRVFIAQLRGKLEKDPTAPDLILTEAGIGYRLKLPA